MSDKNELNKELLELIRGGSPTDDKRIDDTHMEFVTLSKCPECGMIFDAVAVEEYQLIDTDYITTGSTKDILIKCPYCNNFVHFEPLM